MRPSLARVPLYLSISVLAVLTGLLFSAGVAFGSPSTARTYSVEDGDTLYGIAAKLGIDDDLAGAWIKQVLDLNALSDGDMLKVGSKLDLPDAAKVAQDRTRALLANAPAVRAYTVQDGDTLSDIAYNAGVPVGDQSIWIGRVLELNDLDEGDNLRVGMKLQLPASPKDASAGLTLSTVSGTTTGAATSTSPTTTTYKVVAGDTLSSIADHFGVSDAGKPGWISSVLDLNAKDSPDALTEGESLKVPVASGSQVPSGAAVSSVSTKPGTYTVKAGDSLYTLAESNGIKDTERVNWIHNVMDLNHLSDADTLAEGQVLQIPPKGSTGSSSSTATPPKTTSKPAAAVPAKGTAFFTVQPGDNLFKIASRLGIPAEKQITWIYDVLKLNNLSDSTSLKEGSTLTMPAGVDSGAAVATTTSTAPAPSASTSNTVAPPASTSAPVTVPPNSTTAGGTNADGSQQKSCFYVVKATDTLDSISKTLGVSASKKDTWIASVTSLNGISGAALPVGDAIRLPC